MKCIFKINEFAGNHLSRSELWTEIKDGRTAPLFQSDKLTGIVGRLFISAEGYRLELASRETYARGTETDVFAVYDSMKYKPEPLLIIDQIRGEEMLFPDYERKYGVGRVERDNKRKFLVYSEPASEQGTAFGLVEHSGNKTLAIHSLYVPECLSNKDRTEYLAEYIANLLDACDIAHVTACGINRERGDLSLYSGMIWLYGSAYRNKFEQSRLLYLDAINRKESISEVFNEPIQYQLEGLFESEEKVS